MWFSDWESVYRILWVGVLSYAVLILLLRISGKRTLAKMNAFDLVVTVALGSTLSSIILDRSVSLAEGVLALGLLISLQFVVAWTVIRSEGVAGLVKSDPVLLFHRGRFLDGSLRAERVARAEVIAAIRSSRFQAIEEVEAVVLETDGSFSVIPRSSGPATSLRDIERQAS